MRLIVTGEGLSELPAPDIIETLDFQVIRQAILDDHKARYPDSEVSLKSEPVVKLLETVAYRELLLRQRVNEGARAVLLGEARETELLYIGKRFGVTRQIVDEGDPSAVPPIPPTYEPLERFRDRIQLALDGRSTAGPEGSYIFHVLSASPLIKDVSVDAPEFATVALAPEIISQLPANTLVLQCTHSAGLADPMPGDIAITTLQTDGNGSASTDIDSAVLSSLSEDVVPLSDRPRLVNVDIIEYQIAARLEIPNGPDAETIRATAQDSITRFVVSQHRLGRKISLSGVYAALHVAGVTDVHLDSPPQNIDVATHQAAFCTSITVARENP